MGLTFICFFFLLLEWNRQGYAVNSLVQMSEEAKSLPNRIFDGNCNVQLMKTTMLLKRV